MTVEIGNPHGRITLHLDYDDAWAIASAFPYPDRAHEEMLSALREAYPHRMHADGACDPQRCPDPSHDHPAY